MAVQMPAAAVGPAAGILVHSCFSFSCGLILAWLIWVHNERKSYVLLLTSFISLHELASITQQIHTIIKWDDIKTSQWENVRDNVGNPELNITGASTGLDLPIFYIQYYCYNVESMLIVCWAVELANSIFQVQLAKNYGRQFSITAKLGAIFIPLVSMLLLRFSPIQKSTPAFLFVSSGIMVFCFLLGAITLFCILVKYISSRLLLTGWNVRYGRNTEESGTGTANDASTRRSVVKPKMKNIYDKWLVTRFSIAFIALSLFQLVVVNFQVRAAGTNNAENIPEAPDLSAGRAISDCVLYIPGATAGLLTFLVFGTTRNFRDYMWKSFAPKCLQRKREARKDAKRHRGKPSVVIPDPNAVLSTDRNRGAKPLPPVPANDEEAQYAYGENGVKMQNLGVSVWIEGGAKAGAAGMGPEALSSPRSQVTTTTKTHLHSNPEYMGPEHLRPGPSLSDDLGNKSETDDGFPIMKHSSRNSSHSMVVFLDKDSSNVDLESQKGVTRAGSGNTHTTQWP
ncbi:hypothetical protein QBC43DRAFT_68789 [Cladorrhinum sp. PSN259]|nr:hypothetical protein QBC43DRAFT_68789 [Cladorrhinum sp. PSN259]